MKGGYYKPIKDIKIGDTLSFYNKVIGIVKISNKFVHYYKDKNGIIVTSNTKVFDEGIWKNIEKIPDIEPQKNIDYTDAINLVTENSTLRINCGKKSKHYRDYLEFIDTELDTEIENLTLKNANM